MKYNEISSLIWNICDDVLRGLFKPHQYGDVILPFVVLRRLDCILEPHKDEVVKLHKELKGEIDDPSLIIKRKTGLSFYNFSEYDLSRLKGDPNGLKINFPNYLNGFSENVYEIIENFQLDKPIETLIKNNKLYLLIDKLTEVDFHPDVIDNHTMGQVFEELLRKFSEMSNETSGEHYTPRDILGLLVSLVFIGTEENLKGEGLIRSIYDPCSGTGGILTIGKEWIKENISSSVKINLYGQELNPQSFSICKSDFLITGEDPENIKLGSTLSNDQFEDRKFDYSITNPPFGVSWKSDEEFVKTESQNPNGRFSVGTPRISDGSLLFLQHLISKFKDDHSRIGIVFNGSPLFSGDSGSGESEIRRWIIENDWLECIVQLPDQLFFNTGITTYLWILSKKKSKQRKGKIQLIDGSNYFRPLKKSLGNKRKEISDFGRDNILKLYQDFQETEISKIYPNEFFGYKKLVIEQPLMEDGKIVLDKKGNPKPDGSLRDTERIPLDVDIDEYFEKEVKPHLPNSWVDKEKTQIGYEINFTKYFYKYTPLRSVKDVLQDLLDLEKESDGLMNELIK
jgi:type I restriction enzyme M protein